jgi:hypothetical protein
MTSLQSAVFAVALGVAALAAQQTATPGGIPPLEYTCPHHGDHLQAKPGTCPMPMEGAPGGICRMQLVPVRIELNRTGFVGGPIQREDGVHGTTKQVLAGVA